MPEGSWRGYLLAALAGVTVGAGASVAHRSFTSGAPPLDTAKSLKRKLHSIDQEESLWREQLVRNYQFWGDSKQRKIENAFVVVVGLGGVGSHCAIALARSGVRRLRLIDFDQLTLSSLNRHGCGVRSDVGKSKCEVLRTYIQAVSPYTQVETKCAFFCKERAYEFIVSGGVAPDFVVDCIDNITTKADLIKFCYDSKIRCVSSGGAGAKCDPTKVRIDYLSDTKEDELCRSLRRILPPIVTHSHMICYSIERSTRSLLPLKDFQENNVNEYRVYDKFRVRIIPVLGTLPAITGNTIATYVLCHLADEWEERGCVPGFVSKLGAYYNRLLDEYNPSTYKQLYSTLKQHLHNLTDRSMTSVPGGAIPTCVELPYEQTKSIYIDMFVGQSALAWESKKVKRVSQMQIVPWRCTYTGPSSLVAALKDPHNAVLLTLTEATQHLKSLTEGRNPEELYPEDTIKHIDDLLMTNQGC